MWGLWRRRRRERRKSGCRACGICCEMYGHDLRAVASDRERWQEEGRLDLVGLIGAGGVLWQDRATGDRLPDCPFLQRTGPDRARCRIHHTKPEVCRAYPTPVHGSRCLRGVRFDEP